VAQTQEAKQAPVVPTKRKVRAFFSAERVQYYQKAFTAARLKP
jgi:hypothetical protein